MCRINFAKRLHGWGVSQLLLETANETRKETKTGNKDFTTETYFFTMIKDKKRAHFMTSISIMIAN